MTTVAPTFEKMFSKLGIDYTPTGRRLQLCCVFHADTNPSAAVYDDGDQESYHCWTCSLTINPIQFYEKYKDIPYQQARSIVESDFNFVPRKPKYDNVVVLKECGLLNESLHAHLYGLSRTFACKVGEVIDQLEWSVRQGIFTQEQFVTAAGNLRRKIKHAVK